MFLSSCDKSTFLYEQFKMCNISYLIHQDGFFLPPMCKLHHYKMVKEHFFKKYKD